MRSLTLRRSALATAVAVAALTCSSALAAPDSGFQVYGSLDNSQQYGAVGMDVNGNQLVVWKEAHPDGSRVLAQEFRALTDEGGDIVVLAEHGVGDSMLEPALAMLPSDGGVVVWHGTGATPGSDRIVAQRVFNDGYADGPAFIVAQDDEVSHAFPAIAMSRNGYHWATTWRATDAFGRDDVMVRPYVLDSALDVAQAVNEGGEVYGLPQVAMGYDDSYVVVWIEAPFPDSPTRNVMARRFQPWGGAMGEPMPLYGTSGSVDELRIAQTGDDGLVVAWNILGGGVQVNHYGSGLVLQNTYLVPERFPGESMSRPRLAVDRQGGVTLAFDTFEPEQPELTRVRVVRFDAQGQPLPGYTLYGGEWTGENTAGLAVDADGDAAVLWKRSDEEAQASRLHVTRVLHEQPIDLQVRAVPQPAVHRGTTFYYDVRVFNGADYAEDGIHATSNFSVELIVPPEATIEDRNEAGWRCGPPQTNRVACSFVGSLLPQQESYPLLVQARAPDASMDLIGQARVIARHIDPDPGNDETEIVQSVRDLRADAFTFVDRTGVARGSEQVSEEILVSGLEAAVPLFVSQGQYSLNAAAWSTADVQVQNGDRVRVRHTAASAFGASVTTTLNLGGTYDHFTTTTETRDTTPDAFAFVDQGDVGLGVPVTSAPITVAGINDAVTLSVSGGTYSLNGGAFTAVAGTARAGDTIRVQHTAALTPETATNTVLTVGGVSDTFTSTTVAPDTTPEPFAFGAETDVALSSERTSAEVQISGINTAAPIGVTGGSYSINGGAFTSAAGTITNGQFVRVRHTAASAFSTVTTTQLTIGGTSGTFASTTLARDVTPDAFAFAAQADVPRGSERTSAEVTIAGINDAAPVSVAGGSYSIDGGAFTSAAGTIANGQRLRLRHTAAAGFSAATTTTVTVGTANAAFSSTTEAQDAVPDAFAFVDRSGLATAVESISAPVTVAGINVAAPVSVAGGSYSVNGGAFVTAAGTVQAGDTVRVRHVTASSASTAVSTTLTIGGVSDAFTSTTGASDSTPNAYAFADVSGAKRNKSVTSAPISVAGINVAVPISVAGGGARWSKNGGAFTSSAGSVVAGDQVRLQLTAPNASNFTVNVQVSIGGVADTWTVSGN
jgi:hypothetical protein